MRTQYIFSLILGCYLMGCTKENIKLLAKAESVLPGHWEIESIRLPGYGLGITYQGDTFFNDTLLFVEGIFEIGNFSTDSLSSTGDNIKGVQCKLRMDKDEIPVGMKSLFMSGDRIFSRFEFNGPHGAYIPDSDAEKFFWSSFIFNNNYIIMIINDDHIELGKANDRYDHVISLKRI